MEECSRNRVDTGQGKTERRAHTIGSIVVTENLNFMALLTCR
jgi:hypothetical protein